MVPDFRSAVCLLPVVVEQMDEGHLVGLEVVAHQNLIIACLDACEIACVDVVKAKKESDKRALKRKKQEENDARKEKLREEKKRRESASAALTTVGPGTTSMWTKGSQLVSAAKEYADTAAFISERDTDKIDFVVPFIVKSTMVMEELFETQECIVANCCH